jgi:hypothetical protein
MGIKVSVIVGITAALTLSSVAFGDLAIRYDSCGFRSLAWDAVAGATTYKVERKECDNCTGEWKTLSLEADTSTDDLDSPALAYRVRALSIGGVVLETALLAGDGVTVQRLAITPLNPKLPVTACGAPLQLEVQGTIPATGVTFEWRRNGVVVATTSVPLLNVAMTAEDCGAEYSVTAQSACGVSQCQWAPVSTVGARSSPRWRWISVVKTVERALVDVQSYSGNDPCNYTVDNSGSTTTVTGPCQPGSLLPAMFTVDASAGWTGFDNYGCTGSVMQGTLCCRNWQVRDRWSTTIDFQAEIADAGNLLLTVIGKGSCRVFNNGSLIIDINQPVELNIPLQAGNVAFEFWLGVPAPSQMWTTTLQGTFTPTFPDCNSNLRPDATDISSGLSADIDANNTPDECQTVTVPGEYASIQAAIDAAPASEMRIISVAAGTYAGPIAFNGKPVIVRGASAASTVIDGNGGQQLSVVRFPGGEPSIAALERVTVRGGTTGSPIPNSPTVLVGGGIFGIDSAASVRDCVVEQNAGGFGGGAYFLRCTGEVRGTTIRNNNASSDGGGFQANQGSQQLTDVVIENNTCNSRGGGMHLVQGNPTLTRVTVRNNYSNNVIGGVSWYALGSATATLPMVDCTVTSNGALLTQGGIGVSAPSTGTPTISLQGTNACDNTPRPNITGNWTDLGGNTICDCVGDLTLDGFVNGADLGILLASWGACTGSCASDLNRDGVVNGADLGVLLAAWGVCGG